MFNSVRFAPRRAKFYSIIFASVLAVAAGGCKYIMPVDTTPLDVVGMNFDSIEELKALKITAPEVAEIAKAKQGRMSDSGCVATAEDISLAKCRVQCRRRGCELDCRLEPARIRFSNLRS